MRLVLWFLLVAVLVLAGWGIWGGGWEAQWSAEGAKTQMEAWGSWAWLMGMGLLAADLVLPVPGTLVMSGMGWMYGAWWGGLAAAAGSMLAGLSGYGVGRMIGERGAKALLGERDLERGRKLFREGGAWLIALSRALPILPEALSCTAGLVRMPFRRFAVSLASGSVPVGFLYAAIGAAGHEAPGWAVAASLGVPALCWALAKRWVGEGR